MRVSLYALGLSLIAVTAIAQTTTTCAPFGNTVECKTSPTGPSVGTALGTIVGNAIRERSEKKAEQQLVTKQAACMADDTPLQRTMSAYMRCTKQMSEHYETSGETASTVADVAVNNCANLQGPVVREANICGWREIRPTIASIARDEAVKTVVQIRAERNRR